jgi:hypothetical protein
MISLQQAGRLSSPRSWPVPAALVALSAIPLVAGTLRPAQLTGGPIAVAEWVIRRPRTAVALAGAPT